MNNEIVDMCAPLFSNLLKTIRVAHEEEKNMFEREKRELEALSRFRTAFIDKIVVFESKIMRI